MFPGSHQPILENPGESWKILNGIARESERNPSQLWRFNAIEWDETDGAEMSTSCELVG